MFKMALELPAEVLSMVFRCLNRSDLLNMRLVCHHFETVTNNVLKLEKNMTPETLVRFLESEFATKHTWKLSLTKGDEQPNRSLSLQKHFLPMKTNCYNLKELCLIDVTVDGEVCIDDLPPSLRVLRLNRVTFQRDSDFFMSKTNDTKLKLRELGIDATKLSCFALLHCFGPSLKALILKDIDSFPQLHFNLLRWRFPQLEEFELHTKYGVSKDLLEVIGTFLKLKRLELKDDGYCNWVIEGFKELSPLVDLETIVIYNLTTRGEESAEMPIFRHLERAVLHFRNIPNKFYGEIAVKFPNLTSLQLLVSRDTPNTNVAMLVSMLTLIGEHPTLRSLSLKRFHILDCDTNVRAVVSPSRIVSLELVRCSIADGAIPVLAEYFADLTRMSISSISKSRGAAISMEDCISQIVRRMRRLKEVTFLGKFVTDSLVESVANCLPDTLEHLVLGHAFSYDVGTFGDRSLSSIANKLHSLKMLTITSNNLTVAGILEVCQLKNLVQFDLKSTNIKGDQLETLERMLPILNLGQ